MADKKPKTKFGRLLEQYREEYRGPHREQRRGAKQGLSQLGLEHLLWNNDYYITNGLVNKYESGQRTPPAHFIHAVVRVLALGKDKEDALLQARIADDQLKFMRSYGETLE
jgi:hypothetical protein